MPGQPSFFDVDERHAALSAAGDPLERLASVVDFELFRAELDAALARSDRARDGRPPYDPVLMFKVLIVQTLYSLSDDQAEYQIRDRLSFMRFLGLALEDRVPDAKTIWLFREQLTRAGAIERLFRRFDAVLRAAGYLAMGGQIVDATVIQARRPRLSRDEKATVKGGAVPEGWSKAKRAQMDTDGRWTLKRVASSRTPTRRPSGPGASS
jgi:transposase, IS5 family